jgi:hypothetical protein
MVGLLAGSFVNFNSISPSIAANYGGFGSSYSEVIDPKTAVINEETYKSDEVKAGLEGLNGLLKAISSIKAELVFN